VEIGFVRRGKLCNDPASARAIPFAAGPFCYMLLLGGIARRLLLLGLTSYGTRSLTHATSDPFVRLQLRHSPANLS